MSRWLRELHAQKAAPTWSGSVVTLNDPGCVKTRNKITRIPYLIYLIAVVLFCLFCLVSLLLETLRRTEWYVAFHPDGVVSAPTGKVGL